MHVLVEFDGREAIPVRAIPLLTDWTRMSPDQIAAALAWDITHFWQFQGLTAFTLEGGSMRSIPNTWWSSIQRRELLALQDRIESTQISQETGTQEWRRQSLLALPAGVFVWRNEYEPMYYRTVGPASRIFTIGTSEGVPDPGLLPYVQLQFDPYVSSPEVQRLVMEGFILKSAQLSTKSEEEADEEEEIFEEEEEELVDGDYEIGRPVFEASVPKNQSTSANVSPTSPQTTAKKAGWLIKKPKRRDPLCDALITLLTAMKSEGLERPKARQVLDAFKKQHPPEIVEVTYDELKFETSTGDHKPVSTGSLQKRLDFLII